MDTVATGEIKAYIVVEIVEYAPNKAMRRTVIKRASGGVTSDSFNEGKGFDEKTTQFDNYIQIIDGQAEVLINKKPYQVRLGEGITIPANSRYSFQANKKFTMVSTTIKSGYAD